MSSARPPAWLPATSSTAAEFGTGSLLQSTAVANIIFVNIDWKRSRHNSQMSTRKNLTKLGNTTSSIVTKMKPAVICCCEAGTANDPMTSEEMSAMADAMRMAWETAATERPVIRSLFEEDAPYLTIWDDNRCKCTHGRILNNVYHVPGHQRTAQAFLCTFPGESDEKGIDVVNVHAPSGSPKLKDAQRRQLIENLLQSNSMTRANRPIGEGRFLIGGDMNTTEVTLGQILDNLRNQGILKRNTEVMVPLNGKHGDICVVGGFTTTLVQERADNHDPKHEPYGIAWRKQPQHATEQLTTTPLTQIPTAPDTTTEPKATGATAAAVPTGRTPKQTQPDPQAIALLPERQPSQLPLLQLPPEEGSASAWLATEQPDELVETVTEQSHTDEREAPELDGPGQEMAYVIVNAFLNNVTFQSTEAETWIKRAILNTGEGIRPDMLDYIDEVFRPIFFYYPNGLDDRTRAVPRNASQYISHWRDIAAWRHMSGVGAQQHATRQQVQHILHRYIDNFIENEADDEQRQQSWTKNKSKAEAVLRRLCGSAMMAKVIWRVDLPNISEALPATEQQQPSIATATETILNWLSHVANAVHEHKATPAYQEHARKSGTQKNRSGLTDIESAARADKKRAARQKYRRQPSTASGSDTRQMPAQRQWRADTWQAPARWQGHSSTWQTTAQWQWHADTWQAPAQWQWHR